MESKPKSYKDLILWQRSFEVTTMVLNLVKRLPKTFDVRIILNQLLRAVMSVGANISEGYGRYGSKEYSRYLQVSLGSANETDYWLSLLKVSLPSFGLQIDKIIDKNMETIKMLATSIKTIKNKIGLKEYRN